MKRGRWLAVIAAVLACLGGAYRTAVHSSAAAPETARAGDDRAGPAPGGSPASSGAILPGTVAAVTEAEPECDLDAPDSEKDEAQEARETEAQARYDLALAQRLRATGNRIDQAVGSLLGRIEDWEPRELSDQVAEVARAAVLTSDGKLYALALKACARLRYQDSTAAAPEACFQLADSRPTQLQPDEVMVWLDAAKSARYHHDTAGELDALYHASVARQGERPGSDAIRALGAAMAPTDPAWLRYGALRKLSEKVVSSGSWGFLLEASSLAGSCDREELGDSTRRQLCENLARNLLDRPAHSAALWVGTLIGTELQWPSEHLGPFYSKTELMFTAGRVLAAFPPHDCRAGVQLAILEATIAPDAPARLSAPRLQPVIDALVLKQRETEAAVEQAAKEAAKEAAKNGAENGAEKAGAEKAGPGKTGAEKPGTAKVGAERAEEQKGATEGVEPEPSEPPASVAPVDAS